MPPINLRPVTQADIDRVVDVDIDVWTEDRHADDAEQMEFEEVE